MIGNISVRVAEWHEQKQLRSNWKKRNKQPQQKHKEIEKKKNEKERGEAKRMKCPAHLWIGRENLAAEYIGTAIALARASPSIETSFEINVLFYLC